MHCNSDMTVSLLNWSWAPASVGSMVAGAAKAVPPPATGASVLNACGTSPKTAVTCGGACNLAVTMPPTMVSTPATAAPMPAAWTVAFSYHFCATRSVLPRLDYLAEHLPSVLFEAPNRFRCERWMVRMTGPEQIPAVVRKLTEASWRERWQAGHRDRRQRRRRVEVVLANAMDHSAQYGLEPRHLRSRVGSERALS